MSMKIDEKTLRRIIREELTGTPEHGVYDRLTTSLGVAVDAASDLLDIADESGSANDIIDAEEILMTLTQLLTKIGDSMSRKSIANKRSRFRVVK